MRNITIFLICILIVGVGMGVYYNMPEKKVVELENENICNHLGFLYLKPSEKHIRPTDPSIIRIFPEENLVVANTQITQCENFHYNDYINNLFDWSEN